MVFFEPISEEDFAEYWNYAVYSWLRDEIRAGLIDSNTTIEEGREHVRKFLPEGMNTPGHYFLNVIDQKEIVGKVWVEVRDRGGIEAYLWDIVIEENYRGRGYGSQTMKLLESFVVGKGARKMSLNVFGYNEIARNLYRKSGYRDAAITMIKDF